MSPLIEGEHIYSDKDLHTLYWWMKLFGFSNGSVVSAAAIKGGAKIIESDPHYCGQPNQRLMPVSDFPQIIKGFQETGRRPDGHHYHQWALNVDTRADRFEVTPPSGKKLIYSRQG